MTGPYDLYTGVVSTRPGSSYTFVMPDGGQRTLWVVPPGRSTNRWVWFTAAVAAINALTAVAGVVAGAVIW